LTLHFHQAMQGRCHCNCSEARDYCCSESGKADGAWDYYCLSVLTARQSPMSCTSRATILVGVSLSPFHT
jgi:hypothetical protein